MDRDSDNPSRRDFLRATLRLAGGAGAYSAVARFTGAGAGLSLLTGCQQPRTPQELVEKLIFAITSDVKSFDPAYIVMALDGYISTNIHEPLTWYDKQVNLCPRLALKWEALDAGRRWIFHLRPGVRFHDGTPLTAEAVKIHFDRVKDPKTKSNRISRIAPMKEAKVLDELTIQFELNDPFAVWPEQIRSGWAAITSPKRTQSLSTPQDYTKHPIGTGPFVFKEYVPDQFIRLERNPDYWDPDAIRFESLEFRPIREGTTRLIMVEQNRVDIAPVSFSHVDLAAQSDKMVLIRSPHLATSYVGLNCMRPPLDNPKVRRALNRAVNREALVKKALRGVGTPAVGPIPKAVQGQNPSVTGYDFDPELARKELREAGVPKGTVLKLWSTERSEERLQCELLKEMLREVGLVIEPVIIDQAAYWSRFDRYGRRDSAGNPDWRPNDPGVYDMFIAGWVGGESQWGYLDPLFNSTSVSNRVFFKNDEVDALLKQAMATVDNNERIQVFQRLEAKIFEEAPWIFMYDRQQTLVTRRGVRNFLPHPAGEYEFQGVSLFATEGEV